MKIKRIKTVSDKLVSAMAQLIPQLSAETLPPSFSDLRKIVANADAFLFVAEEDNRIVGALTLITYRIPTGRRGWIEDVVVDASARGKGIGALLVKHALNVAEDAGIEKIDLTSNPSRVEANELYKKLGFSLRETNVYRYQKARKA